MIRPPRALAALAGLLATLLAAPGAARADDSPAAAIALSPGATLSGRIFPGRDRDWFRFDAIAGDEWTLRTTSSWPMDTTLTLVASDGRTALAFDDDGGGGRASRLVFRAPADGPYFAVVAHYDRWFGIGGYALSASVVPAAAPPPTGGATLALDTPRVYDPKLEDGAGGAAALPVDLRVDPAGSYLVDLEVRDLAGARLARLLSSEPVSGGASRRVSWSGTAPLGPAGASVFVDPGAYRLRLSARRPGTSASSAPLAVLEREVQVVRLGAASIALNPAPGGPGTKIHYLFHKGGGSTPYRTVFAQDPDWRLSGRGAGSADPGDLDQSDGRPRASPLPWTDTVRPPAGETWSRPAVIARGGPLEATLTLGRSPVSQVRPGTLVTAGYPLPGAPIRVLVDGVVASGAAAPGATLTAPLTFSLPSALSRGEASLRLTFEVQEGGAWRAVPGEQRARVRVYAVLGVPDLAPPGVSSGAAPYLPWLAVIDLVCGNVAPGVSDPRALLARSADHVFERMGLSYDTTNGSPAYALGNLDELELDLSALFDRANGSRVNCSDCATLLSTLANMVGADVDYVIVGYNFPLNYMRILGSSSFSNDPFRQGTQGAFSFHAVGSQDGAITVDDACLALDGDGAPGSLPCTEARPRGMRFDAYRAGLTTDAPAVQIVRRPKLR